MKNLQTTKSLMEQEQKKKTNKKFIIILAIMVIAGLVIGGYVYFHSLAHEETNDAHVNANMIPVIPHVGGYIQQVFVTDHEFVTKGDTLFTIDAADYMVALSSAQAALAQAKAQLAVAQASIGTSQANYIASKSQVRSAASSITSAKIKFRRAKNDFKRYKNLYQNHSITRQKYEQALAAKQQAQESLEIMKSRKLASKSQSHAADLKTTVMHKQVAVAQAHVESAKAMIHKAQLNMGYTVVTAPFSGQLSDVDLLKGQFVSPGQSLFYLVNSTDKWVTANFKETQLTNIKIGQKVIIHVDAYPAIKFYGQVASLSPATGSQFSLLPPNNATGNFVKTVQRLPVKITFTETNKTDDLENLRSGMNVEVDIHTK